MFKVGDKVHVSNTKTQSRGWKDTDGVIIQILDGFNSLTGKEEKIHIVRNKNNSEAPVECCYMTKL